MVFRWDAKADAREPTAEPSDPARLARYRDFLQGLFDESETAIEAVRRRAVRFYRNGQ